MLCLLYMMHHCFNPSQVGYKPLLYLHPAFLYLRFNPSQVGYKLRR